MRKRNRLAAVLILVFFMLLFVSNAFALTLNPAVTANENLVETIEDESPLEESYDPDFDDSGSDGDLLVDIPFEEDVITELVGGDFSSADDFDVWWMQDVYVSDVSELSLYEMDGNSCAGIISNEQNDARLEQSVDVLPNSYYHIRTRVMAENIVSEGDYGANIGIRGVADGSKSVFETEGQWEDLELYVQTGEDQYSLTVSLCVGGYGCLASGSAWFDDVTIEKVESVPTGASLVLVSDYAQGLDEVEEIPEEGAGTFADTTKFLLAIAVFALVCAYLLYVIFRSFAGKKEFILLSDPKQTGRLIVVTLAAALILRLILALTTRGHPTDINCFSAWAELVVQHGIKNFYTSGFFADYPPGYIYVLYIIGTIKNLLGMGSGALYIALVKLPAIIVDIVAARLIFSLAQKKLSKNISFALMLIAAFNPTTILNSSVWAQIDSILSLLLIVVFMLIAQKRMIWAAAVYGAAVLLKPQALMAGPVFALPYIFAFFNAEHKKGALKTLLLSALAAFAVILIGALPFTGSQEPLWLIDKYVGTMKSYPYASIHAFNLFSMLGGNWVNQAVKLGPLTYEHWGTIGMALAVCSAGFFAYKARKNNTLSLALLTSFLLCALFSLAHNMHERYAFPTLLLLCMAYIELKDKRLIRSLAMYTAVTFINIASVLFVSQTPAETSPEFMLFTRIASVFSVAVFGYFAYTCYDIFVNGRIVQFLQKRPLLQKDNCAIELLKLEPVAKTAVNKRDMLLMLVLTGVYAVVAFVNLGTTKVPTSYWQANEQGQVVTVDFGQLKDVASIWSYGGISDSTIEINAVGENGDIIKAGTVNVNFDEMFRWNVTELPFAAQQVVIDTPKGLPWINELAFMDANGQPISVQSVQVSGAAGANKESDITHLFDEQQLIPERPSRYNGMYFDELYHARTALEHLKGLEPYENSHPPLGKVFIMLGIALFGMVPFGWRFAGALFGVGMVPIMYLFGKRLFKRTDYAFFTAFLMTFDFMHFVQTRIATIDVFAVFFIILMYYFMYRYYEMNFFVDGLKKTLLPLGLSGLFFALGVASKWICIYAGAGLAVLLFVSLFKRFKEYRAAKRAAAEGTADADAQSAIALTEKFTRYFVLTGVFSILFFIVLPVVVYILSYLPYMLCKTKPYDLKGIWDVQKFMYNYHSALTATHPFESKWYTWPVMAKPIWYYKGEFLPEGTVEGIFAMGNPAVWWSGLIGLILLLVGRLRKATTDKRAAFLLIGFAAQFLPWTLISRATFIYHYFASVPFIIFALAYVLLQFEKIYKIAWVKYALMVATLLLFIAYYPALSGTPVPLGYASLLKWFGSWVFY